jgi:hypothetical protein
LSLSLTCPFSQTFAIGLMGIKIYYASFYGYH